MKIAFTGIESSGKSLQLAVHARTVFLRNVKWYKITGKPRKMAFDSPMSETFTKAIEDAGLKYIKFRDLNEILPLDNTDIFINETLKYFPASGSNALTPEQMDFLTQGAKNGVDIYCASQDFSQVHKQFRLLMNEVVVVSKLCGSMRPIPTAPPVKRVWGICMLRAVDPKSFKGDTADMKSLSWFPSFYFINKLDCDLFDTSYKVPLSKLPPKKVRKQEILGYDDDGNLEFRKITWV